MVELSNWGGLGAALTDRTPSVVRWSNILSVLIITQVAFGAVTLLTLAPILMQLGHLFLADAVWISFVLLTACYLGASKNTFEEKF